MPHKMSQKWHFLLRKDLILASIAIKYTSALQSFFFLVGILGCLFWIARQSNSVGYSKDGRHHSFCAVQIWVKSHGLKLFYRMEWWLVLVLANKVVSKLSSLEVWTCLIDFILLHLLLANQGVDCVKLAGRKVATWWLRRFCSECFCPPKKMLPCYDVTMLPGSIQRPGTQVMVRGGLLFFCYGSCSRGEGPAVQGRCTESRSLVEGWLLQISREARSQTWFCFESQVIHSLGWCMVFLVFFSPLQMPCIAEPLLFRLCS